MWSLDGDSLLFPPDVSLTVGGDSGIQHLVLQVHYISKDRIPQQGDTSGVLVSYQSQPTPYSAGIVSLHVHGVVPGGQEPAMWDSACRLLGSTPVQPWAYLGHTHKLGHLVTGETRPYRTDQQILTSPLHSRMASVREHDMDTAGWC